MPSVSTPPVDRPPSAETPHREASGRSADSLPQGAGEAGRTDDSGRAPEDLEGDPAIHENEDGDGL